MHNVANSFDNTDDGRKREFKRQQDRLKMLAPDSERKAVTADSMIDSLLQKSDTFRKSAAHNYPSWLKINTQQSCAYYEKIWSIVCISEKLVDTARISQLLLTSGLHPDILGFIWNIANKETPGQLNKQELFVVLSLVGLAQSGCSFNSIDALSLLPAPPIPRLNVPFLPQNVKPCPSIPTMASQVTSPILQHSSILSTNVGTVYSNNPSTLTANQATSIEDDFQDFQFASVAQNMKSTSELSFPTMTLSSPLDVRLQGVNFNTISQPVLPVKSPTDNFLKPLDYITPIERSETKAIKKETTTLEQKLAVETDEFADFQSADAFDTSIVQPSKISLPKLSSFINVSPESERKLRHLNQPESLTALPESKISSRNQVSSMPSIAVLGSSRSVGSRLANHSLGKSEKIKHHQKFMKVKPLVSASSSSIGSEDIFPKCIPKNSTFLLKETKILSADLEENEPSLGEHELTRRIEIPSVGTFKETTLPVDMKTSISEKQDGNLNINNDALLQVEGDKYGALRELELFKEVPEDFGEFLSADLSSEKVAEAWSAWNSSIIPETAFEASFNKSEVEKKVDELKIENIDLLGDSFTNLSIKNDKPSDIIFGNLIEESPIDEFGDFVTTVDNNSDKIIKQISKEENKSMHSSTPSIDFSLTRQDSWSSLEMSGDKDLEKYRKESVPSLNFELEVNSQQLANRCLNCCHGLLKEAVDIFKSVTDKAVLQEIFDSPQAKDYLKHLCIVYSMAKRIYQNETDSNSLFEDIRNFWEQLEIMAPDILSQDVSLTDASGSLKPCLLCKGLTSDLDIEKDGYHYHISCANLWINCIESTLPSI